MTNHIINFTIGIEDDKIIENIEQNAEKQIKDEIKKDVLKAILRRQNYYYRQDDIFEPNGSVKGDVVLTLFAERLFREIIGEHKDAIIEKAAEKLAESYRRTKAWKEKAGEVIE